MFFVSSVNQKSPIKKSRLTQTPVLYAGILFISNLPGTLYAAAEEGVLQVNASTKAQTKEYSVPVTRAGTKLALTSRDIPQSVSIISQQRMQDQQLKTLSDVLENTTGITEKIADFDRKTFYSRGFFINNYLLDGIPTIFEENWNLGDADTDTAILERVEVVRGASGLMTGAGNPSAAINLVRKHADSHKFTGDISAGFSRWNNQRYIIDLTTPLIPSGKLRGRVIAGLQDGRSYIDYYKQNKKFIYAVIDADLTDSTALSAGYYYQHSKANSPPWGGVPRWYLDGSLTHYPRNVNTAPDWSYNDKEFNKLFVNITQRFAHDWQFILNGTYTETTLDSRTLYIDGFFDKTTGLGVSAYPGWPVVGGTGYNTGKRKTGAFDAYLSGSYYLFGKQHELMIGGNYSRQNNRYLNDFTNLSAQDVGNFNLWNPHYPQTQWKALSVAQDDTIIQKALYAATRLTLADPLHAIIGARYSQWQGESLTQKLKNTSVTPYAGLIYDINDNWSAYASYSEIFQPQLYRDSQRHYLPPISGKNYEAGIKTDWMNSRLTTSLSVFRIEQNNVGQTDYQLIPGTNEYLYYASQGAISRGVEFEMNGALTDFWQMTFGISRYIATDNKGAFNPTQPRTTIKLFTAYQLPGLPALTLGGGINWQTQTWQRVPGPEGNGTLYAQQGSYPLVNLFARYQITDQLSLQANINNLFDKTYDTAVGGYVVYGMPRQFSVMARYQF